MVVTHRDGKYVVSLGINHPSIIRVSLRITRKLLQAMLTLSTIPLFFKMVYLIAVSLVNGSPN